MMEVTIYNKEGKEAGKLDLSEDVFGVTANQGLIHQALLRQLANKRQGTVQAKTRGEVVGSTRKLFSQKSTGRARRGSAKSPTLRGGGVAFGPRPRSFSQRMPKKMRRLAIKGVLSTKVTDDQLIVLDKLEMTQPKTKEMEAILNALNIKSSALIATAEADANVVKSSRNIKGINITPAALLNVGDLLSHRKLILTVDAVAKIEQLWGAKQPVEAS
ncbi:MAG: 50S ribosomal protein L4 [Chloroflexi bacterium]|nr:50S ribosomal protein L4 [Chloroflexota bacterium]MBT7081929.1 50S ribosomal protein L4 [Chloroflexota bacterium]MBT7290499.1 50S ribosomal protein L4 [Chloroflexota bacterium]